jgi:hypothetical protein
MDPHVNLSVIFGRGRFNPGVIIDPKPEFSFDPEDQEKLAQFRNSVWYVDRDSLMSPIKVPGQVLFSRVTRLTMVSIGQRSKR